MSGMLIHHMALSKSTTTILPVDVADRVEGAGASAPRAVREVDVLDVHDLAGDAGGGRGHAAAEAGGLVGDRVGVTEAGHTHARALEVPLVDGDGLEGDVRQADGPELPGDPARAGVIRRCAAGAEAEGVALEGDDLVLHLLGVAVADELVDRLVEAHRLGDRRHEQQHQCRRAGRWSGVSCARVPPCRAAGAASP